MRRIYFIQKIIFHTARIKKTENPYLKFFYNVHCMGVYNILFIVPSSVLMWKLGAAKVIVKMGLESITKNSYFPNILNNNVLDWIERELLKYGPRVKCNLILYVIWKNKVCDIFLSRETLIEWSRRRGWWFCKKNE